MGYYVTASLIPAESSLSALCWDAMINISSFFCWYKRIDALLVYDVSNLWAEMESSRPNGCQHHSRMKQISTFSPATKYNTSSPSIVQMVNEWRLSLFSLCRDSWQIVTWSTPCLPFSQTRAEAWLASVCWESMRGPERRHLCCIDQKGMSTPDSAGRLSIFLASNGSEWVWIFWKSKLKPELISSFASQCFFSTFNHHFVPLVMARALHVLTPNASLPFFAFSPLPQTCTHRVSSNLAACPWVHTVTKAHFSPSFWCHNLASVEKLCKVFQCLLLSLHRMHYPCIINYLTNYETSTLFSYLF